jgi:hypothetical protein
MANKCGDCLFYQGMSPHAMQGKRIAQHLLLVAVMLQIPVENG